MSRQRALVYGLVTAVLAAAVIAFVGATVGYGRGTANAEVPATVASVQAGSVTAGGTSATSVSYEDDDDERWEDDEDEEHDGDDEHEHEGGGIGGIVAGLFGDDD